MEVKLLSSTPEPLRLLYTAARTCSSSDSPTEIWAQGGDEEDQRRLIQRVYQAGHLSILEHVGFTFAIAGISRVASHQLVRHRLASFAQQSQRYTRVSSSWVTPPSLNADPELKREYEEVIEAAHRYYEKYQERLPKEDIRFVLPQAQTTNLVMTMNLRELISAASLRLCTRAQWEIRELFERIKGEVARVESFLAQFLTPKCEQLGYCPEEDSCGRKEVAHL